MTTTQELFDKYMQKVEMLKTDKDFYSFEEQFAKLHTEFGRQIMEQQLANPEEPQCYKKKFKPGLG